MGHPQYRQHRCQTRHSGDHRRSTRRGLGVASRDADRAAGIAASFGIARSYGNYQALLDDPEIEAIYNPLPNHLHVEWTVKALDAGKHVLCEKPIGLNAAEAQAIVAARDRSGKRVIEAFMVRFHPQWQRIRALVREGRIGGVRTIQSAFVFTVLDPNNVRNRAESAAVRCTTWAVIPSSPPAMCSAPNLIAPSP